MTAAAVIAVSLRSGILCMGSVSFLAPRGRSRSSQPAGYAAFFMLPVHNLRVYLTTPPIMRRRADTGVLSASDGESVPDWTAPGPLLSRVPWLDLELETCSMRYSPLT